MEIRYYVGTKKNRIFPIKIVGSFYNLYKIWTNWYNNYSSQLMLS